MNQQIELKVLSAVTSTSLKLMNLKLYLKDKVLATLLEMNQKKESKVDEPNSLS
jgi:hypothetical protein